jgi:hypothetical protein
MIMYRYNGNVVAYLIALLGSLLPWRTPLILSLIRVTIDGVWIGDSIYWPLFHTTRKYKQYSATADLHTLQTTAANTKSSPAYSVFISRSLATAPNRFFSYPRSVPSFTDTGTELPLNWLCPLLITSQHGPRRNTPFPTVLLLSPRGTCLPSRCLEMAVVYFLISRSLHSNGSTRHNINSIRQSSREADSYSACHEISQYFRIQKVYCWIHRAPISSPRWDGWI